MKILVIPDIHLKTQIIEEADALMQTGSYDRALFIGDLVDDWGQQQNDGLYLQTFNASGEFLDKYPNTLVCYGNHDISYLWRKEETGFSWYMLPICVQQFKILKEKIPYINRGFVLKVDNVIFSHGGLMESFVRQWCPKAPDIPSLLSSINCLPKEILWTDDSPLWARPQYGGASCIMTRDCLQVVGHTPMREVTYEKPFLSVDVRSTDHLGNPIGPKKFVWIDTVTKEWGIAN